MGLAEATRTRRRLEQETLDMRTLDMRALNMRDKGDSWCDCVSPRSPLSLCAFVGCGHCVAARHPGSSAVSARTFIFFKRCRKLYCWSWCQGPEQAKTTAQVPFATSCKHQQTWPSTVCRAENRSVRVNTNSMAQRLPRGSLPGHTWPCTSIQAPPLQKVQGLPLLQAASQCPRKLR